MKPRVALSFLILISGVSLKGQVDPLVLAELDTTIDESSGLAYYAGDNLWTHNDHDPAKIYHIDLSGILLGELTLNGINPIDWEDLAQDPSGNLFIGDFGNNLNDRDDLVIYKIPNPQIIPGDQINPEIINFNLMDQSSFPPSASNLNFDIEAMVSTAETLHLFTRNRSVPFNGYIKHYTLPNSPGSYSAQLIDSLFLNLDQDFGSISGAAISPDGSRMVLLAGQAIYLFTGYSNENFFSGTINFNWFSNNSRKEGIALKDNCTLYISEEQNNNGEAYLLELDLCQILPVGISALAEPDLEIIHRGDGNILISGLPLSNMSLNIIDSRGKIVYRAETDARQSMQINLDFTKGLYILQLGDYRGPKLIHKFII